MGPKVIRSTNNRNISDEVPVINNRNNSEGQNKMLINTEMIMTGKSGSRY
jgi:hypothetical protein